MTHPLDLRMAALANLVSARLDSLLAPVTGPRGQVVDAMRYAVLGGGKRLRPFLVIESAGLFGLSDEQAVDAAAALEMIHCYSLIHDDLPAMDDSDLRRGQATVHKAYDEAIAILAGDGLLTEAFAVTAAPACHPDARVRAELTLALAKAAGMAGMVGGQMIDISQERASLDLAGIRELQALKTGALISFACEAGAILGQAEPQARAALVAYAEDLGLAFQVTDDLLDLTATEQELGKPTGQDADMGKATFVGLLGANGARSLACELVDKAKSRLDIFAKKADFLREIATFVLERRS